ncbi:carboxymuconolactone decarboxylase [Parafrankia colletiae]|uniref:Carboxymuconolactone decarboxylase n=1 Tax=Parafrankia colletiae TaxID=573497 RepID=A0A1S1QKV9_9ACTN|nr:carboxymuconolactone decarboxylase family protein [Frankia sp. Cpl3]OHV34620.1 carboxymuconolactone decarboxylase [Parafrankia colletiae]
MFDSFRDAARSGVPAVPGGAAASPAGAAAAGTDDDGPSGANVFGTLARHPALAEAFLAFNGHVLYGSSLPPRVSELLILRVAALRRCGYEWAQHALRGQEVGITAEEIARVAEGPAAAGWSATDRTLLTAADELLDGAAVGATTWAALAGFLDERQLMDVVVTVGAYDLVAMMFLSFGVEPDPDIVPYLPEGW